MRLRSWATIGLLFWFIGVASADQPPSEQADTRIFSRNGKFFAFMDYSKKRTSVFKAPNGAETAPVRLWEMPGWFRVAALSNDGAYLVVGYPGNNLLDLDYKMDDVMLSFYHKGRLISRVTLIELIEDPSRLRRTASHFFWGTYLGFDEDDRYLLETADNRIIAFDVTTGRPIDTAR